MLGIGERYCAVPWDALTLDQVLNLPKQRLRGVSGFDKDNWPENPEAQGQSLQGER